MYMHKCKCTSAYFCKCKHSEGKPNLMGAAAHRGEKGGGDSMGEEGTERHPHLCAQFDFQTAT